MLKSLFCQIFLLIAIVPILSVGASGQSFGSIPYKSQEVAEEDGVPVLVKHLPFWHEKKGQISFATDSAALKAAAGDRPVLDAIEFVPGTEAVSAPYDAGRLIIIEFASPQVAAEASENIERVLRETDNTAAVHRRIGNYNAIVFDVTDKAAANSLLEEVKYEKQIQWLGDNPFRISAERAFVLTTSDIFLSTVLFILIGMGTALVGGVAAGIIHFQLRERRRAAMTTHTDAGGMIRLNLDGLTPDIVPAGFLKD